MTGQSKIEVGTDTISTQFVDHRSLLTIMETIKNITKTTMQQMVADLKDILTLHRSERKVACVCDNYDVLHTVGVSGLIRSQIINDGVETFCRFEDEHGVFRVSHGHQLYEKVAEWHDANDIVTMRYGNDFGVTRHYGFTLFFGAKRIAPHDLIPLAAYNVPTCATVDIQYHFSLGGSCDEILLPTYTHILECEKEVESQFECQSMSTIVDMWRNLHVDDYAIKLVEDGLIFGYDITRARGMTDVAIACVNYVKLRSGTSVIKSSFLRDLIARCSDVLGKLFEDSLQQQSVAECEGVFGSMRSVLDDYESFKKGPLVSKLYDLSMYCLANELFDGVGLTLTKLNYSKLSQEALRRQYHMGPSFIQCLLDTTLFLCEQGVQCVKLGSIEPLIHGSKSYQQWFDDAMDLQIKSKCLSNPQPHGFTKFEFLKKLNDAIEKGDAIAKFAAQIGMNERKLVRSVLSNLKMIQADCITKGAAQRTRKAPFSLLVYAGSSVGKSTFTDILFTYHAKIAGLPVGSEYRYAVNFNDDFQSGFTTNQWCWLIDDIAFQHPNAANGIDPSVLNVIQANNNAAFITNQADLPDKGRIPMWCEQVIGTTNVKDLNAVFYFTNPLAVQRRFPYVIELAPKEQYTKDGVMLDGQKVPLVGDNEYPDWWKITIWRVVPSHSNTIERQRAAHELVMVTEDMTKFLMWYHETWSAYNLQQEKVLEGNAKFDNILLCDCHHVPLSMCEEPVLEAQTFEFHEDGYIREEGGRRVYCPYSERFPRPESVPAVSQVEQTREFSPNDLADAGLQMFTNERELERAWNLGLLSYLTTYFIQFCMYLFLEFTIFRAGVAWLYTFPVMRKLMWSIFWSTTSDSKVLMHIMGFMGNCVQRKIGRVPFLITLAGALASGVATYKLVSWLWKGTGSKLQAENRDGVKPTPDNEKGENVWYRSDFELTTFDVPIASSSLKGTENLAKIIDKNLVKARFFVSETRAFEQTLVALGGQFYLANNHGVPKKENMRVVLIQHTSTPGVTRNMEVMVSQTAIRRFPDRDQCIIELKCLPPKSGLLKYMSQSEIDIPGKGYMILRPFEGSVQRIEVPYMRYARKKFPHFDYTMSVWECRAESPTKNGDCGSPLVLDSPQGPIIVGLHTLGDCKSSTVAVSVNQAFLRSCLETTKIVASGEPMLNVQSSSNKLGELHPKSVFRYLENGCADVYGSFNGWKASLSSRVTKTYFSDKVCNIFGVSVQHGAPVMKGWRPWRRAAEEMIHPVTKIDESILNKCTLSFINDILQDLPKEELKKIEIYDDKTTVNGAPGVKYVGKMPRNTSMGFPWKKCKKHFLVPDVDDEYPDGVKFTPEVMERMHDMIDKYESGQRAMPVFMGNLKDEATKFKKIDIAKTRVFTGAPCDWSLVVRKYLLSCVRVIQRNKFVFEAAQGTNAQSIEWTRIHNYLTKFGEDRMVAGDYAAFDKSMPPCIILAAFDVLIALCRAAGYSECDIKVVQGIAFDTAFPLVDFNGDLVQFYGSNPSGHPLTVVINGLANALYMRYCYLSLNPFKECDSFKDNVALMTYGDDNVMGVSCVANWFNHTAIQSVLKSVGITYTMADKDAQSIPYIHMNDVSFLKRTWQYNDEVGAYMAPLEEESIYKMLTMCVASKTLVPEAQAMAVVSAAQSEWFFYGKDYYCEQQRKLQQVVKQSGLELWINDDTFPLWENLKIRFHENSKKLM